ncbi:glycosyltransferase [bacterium]|nr:glycosyltransferase [bacterium]
MRILHIAPRYWPALGGAETHIAELSQRLVADGHAVTVVTTTARSLSAFWDRAGQALPVGADRHEGVHILRFPIHHHPVPHLTFPLGRLVIWALSRGRLPVNWLHSLAAHVPSTPALLNWLNTTSESFDLVSGFSIVFESLCYAGLRFAEARKLPYVLTSFTHLGAGDRPGQDRPSRPYTMRHQLDIVRQSTALVCMTQTERDYYTARGIDPARIHTTGSGVTPSHILGGSAQAFHHRFNIDGFNIDGPIVAYLNAIAYDKGATITIEAVRCLWESGEHVSLVMAGTLMPDVERYLAALPEDVRRRITLLGAIDDQTKRDLLAACTVLVNPSRIDSFGIVFLEAWLYRKPVIGSTAWGMADVVSEGIDGLLTPFGNVDVLANAIARLLHDATLAEQLGTAGEAKVYAQHTWQRKYTLLSNLYKAQVTP